MGSEVYISIVLPCYNAESFLEQTITSVLQQPFDSWELVLVNDGSTDRTGQICNFFSARDARIRSIHIENGGAGHARNVGISQAKGTWILFLDADDLFLTNSIDAQLYKQLKEQELLGTEVIFTSVARATDINLKEYVRFFRPEEISQVQYRPNLAFGNGIYRKSFFTDKNVTFFEYQEQDIETAFRYVVFAKAEKKIRKSDIAFYLQRENLLSNTHTWSHIKLHYVKTLVYQNLLENYSNEPNRDFLFEEVVNEIHEFYRYCIRIGVQDRSRIKEINQVFRQSIFNPRGKCVSMLGRRHRITNIIFYLVANLCYTSRANLSENRQAKEIDIDDTKVIMKRLNAVSKYIQECLLCE